MFQVECVAGSSRLWILLRAFHCAVQPFVSRCGIAHEISDVVRIRDGRLVRQKEKKLDFSFVSTNYTLNCLVLSVYLDGWNECSGHVGAEEGGHVQFSHISFFFKSAGNALLTQQLQTGHAVFNTYNIQSRTAGQKQT